MRGIQSSFLSTERPAPSDDGAALQRVLIVDDSPGQLRIMRSMLERWGFTVDAAETAAEALETCTRTAPDIVISDWMMPGMSGLELCRAFRALPRESYGYFILLTAKSEKGDVAAGLDAGADDFLTKPVSAPELRARLTAGARVLTMERALSERNRQLGAALDELRALHEEIDRDLQQARTIQQALVPERSRIFGTTRVSLLLHPSGHVGGDLVGMFGQDRGRFGAYAIDVSGHGITSAMVTARVAGYLSDRFPDQNLALDRTGPESWSMAPPERMVERMNRRLVAEPGGDVYLTLAYVSGDFETGRMSLVQAGHPPPLLLRADGSLAFLGEGGLPVGLIAEARHEPVDFTMRRGDRLLLYSDGFTECPLRGGGMLGEDGLARLFAEAARHAAGEALLQDLFWRLDTARAEGVATVDDVSAVLIEYDALSAGQAA
jgi:sigma-B regulation protein RsbU (phosphoserine phosphatase)